ncbi:MAG: alpha/beta hydrolase [Acidobacteriaceae bacterium]
MPVWRNVLFFLILLLVQPTLWGAAAVKDGYFTTSDRIKLHYLESGKGPTILFVPGWTMPAEIWQPQIDYFSKAYHVVAVDPRSQGESDKPAEGNYPGRRAQDYKELIDHLGGSPVVMVGWSLAVYEGLTFVKMYGTDQLSGLVLVDLNVYTDSTQEVRDGRSAMFHDFQADRQRFAATFVHNMYRKPQPQEYLDRVTAASLKTPTTTGVALLAEFAVKNDMRPVLPKLNIPVLAVMTPANRSAIDFIKAAAPDAQGQVFEDAGHCLFVDDADRFNTLLEGFLKKMGSGKQGSH